MKVLRSARKVPKWFVSPVIPDKSIARYPLYWVVVAGVLVWYFVVFPWLGSGRIGSGRRRIENGARLASSSTPWSPFYRPGLLA